MRSDDEDDEDDFDEEQEEDEDDMMDSRVNGAPEVEDDHMDFDEDEGSNDEEDDGEGEGEDEDEDDEDDDDNEGDDNDEDEDEDEDEEDRSEDEQEGEDVDMANGDEASSDASLGSITIDRPQPPHLVRRSIFVPSFTTPPTSASIEAVVAIPLPTPVHSLATTACSSYLLAGGADGHVRAYDFWASLNGQQLMTAQQKTIVGMGEGVSKAGLARGWWTNEVDGLVGGNVAKRVEPVYSMAVEGDGIWALTGTQSGPINLYTLRHSPGHLVHSLKGHSNVVSCMTLLPSEKGFLSGSWDGTVREWDLNTGTTVRQYPTHGAQISSISLRPHSMPSPSPSPSPRRVTKDDEDDGEEGTGLNVSVTVGPDFDKPRERGGSPKAEGEAKDPSHKDEAPDGIKTEDKVDASIPPDATTEPLDALAAASAKDVPESKPSETNGIPMSDAPSPYDPLFDDEDADGETAPPSTNITVPPSPGINDMAPPASSPPKAPSPAKPRPTGLALPGMNNKPAPPDPPTSTPQQAQQPSSAPSTAATPLFNLPQPVASSSRPAAATIPLLSATSYKAYSDDVFLTSSMDGQVVLIDRRVPDYEGLQRGVGRLMPGEKAPPWCMSACWSGNGNQVLAGRRNGTIDIWDVRRTSTSSTCPNLLRTLRTPIESGPVSCVVALPDGRHVATASQDNIRLWNTHEYFAGDPASGGGDMASMARKRGKGRPPFKIIAGHHGGTVSSMVVDPTSRFLISASGDRGWQGESTKVVLIHEIKLF